MIRKKVLCLLLCLMLLITPLTGCTADGTGSGTSTPDESLTDVPTDARADGTAGDMPTDTEEPTELPDGTESEPATDADTEPESPTEPLLYDLPAFYERAVPGFEPTENLTVDGGMSPETHRIEGEAFTAKTVNGNRADGTEFSEWAAYLVNYSPKSMKDLYLEYKVTVEQAGPYELTALATPCGQPWTSDFWVTVNGGAPTDPKEYRILASFDCPTLNDNGVFKVQSLGTVMLEAGENTVRFTVDPSDPRPAEFGTTCVLFLDWFELSAGGGASGSAGVSIGYAVSPTGDGAEILNAAAGVSVYDVRWPIQLELSGFLDADRDLPWAVLDFNGDTVCEGKLPAGNGLATLTKTFGDHPTGYFSLVVDNETVKRYVVTPPLHTGAYEDSPFAMDFAAYYLMHDRSQVFNVAAAARLMGVTWVRERCDWSSWERVEGTYDFSGTDGVYEDIHRAGLKNLAMLCSSPGWVRNSYTADSVDTRSGMVGGFRDYQLQGYQLARAMADRYAGIVDAWELWNETDLDSFAIEPADLYASWFKAAALGVMDSKAENTVISLAGLCQGPGSDYMNLLMQNNVMAYSHIFNYHQHATLGSGFTPFVYQLMEYMNASVPQYAGTTKPLWISEAGMRMNLASGTAVPTGDQLSAQTSFIVTSTVQSLSYGTNRHFWFILSPYIENGGDFGTFSPALEPYPTVAAEAVMTDALGKAKMIGVLSGMPKGNEGIVFDTGAGPVAVLYSMTFRKGGYAYTFESDYPVTVTDMMGNQTLVEPENGKIKLTVDKNPIYVAYRQLPDTFLPQEFPERSVDFTLSAGEAERVILTPLFDTVSMATDKERGHHIDGYVELKVRILNLNDHDVEGFVEGTCDGLTVVQSDRVTVSAMGTAVCTVILSADGPVNAYLTLTGYFGTDGGTTVSVSRVYTDAYGRSGSVSIRTPANDGKSFEAGTHDRFTFTYTDVQGEVVVFLNGQPFTDFTVEKTASGGNVTMNAAGLTPGRYFLSVGVLSDRAEDVYAYRTFFIKD